jgi:hypothetical protein
MQYLHCIWYGGRAITCLGRSAVVFGAFPAARKLKGTLQQRGGRQEKSFDFFRLKYLPTPIAL